MEYGIVVCGVGRGVVVGGAHNTISAKLEEINIKAM